jgi:hypothetical protein
MLSGRGVDIVQRLSAAAELRSYIGIVESAVV